MLCVTGNSVMAQDVQINMLTPLGVEHPAKFEPPGSALFDCDDHVTHVFVG